MVKAPARPAGMGCDNPVTSGCVQNQDGYMQAVAAQRPFFFSSTFRHRRPVHG